MLRKLVMALLFLSGAAVTSAAPPQQDEKSQEKEFRDSLTNQLLITRGFSADAQVNFRWTGSGLESAAPLARTLGAVEPISVKVKRGRVEIKGTRATVLSNNNGTLAFSEGRPVLLSVDLGDADAATVLPKLKAALFYADFDEALADVPREYGGLLHLRYTHPESRPRARWRGGSAACAAGPASFTRPKVLQSVDPEFSEEARSKKLSGNVMVGLTVGTNGAVTDVWIVRPLGYGLDEEAAKAARQYHFEPATCDGQPMTTQLVIEVNFQIF